MFRIGDVKVIAGEPPDGNPYRADGLTGGSRLTALGRFHDGQPTEGLTFWHMPYSGGASRITAAAEVDWTDLRANWRQPGELPVWHAPECSICRRRHGPEERHEAE